MEQNNNENISDLLSISIEMDEEMEKKKEKNIINYIKVPKNWQNLIIKMKKK